MNHIQQKIQSAFLDAPAELIGKQQQLYLVIDSQFSIRNLHLAIVPSPSNSTLVSIPISDDLDLAGIENQFLQIICKKLLKK